MHVLNILWVVFGIGLMLVLNLKFKINSMVALLVAALSVGMLAGMDLMSLLHTMKAGFGNTLAKGVREAVQEQGILGVLTGGLKASAAGIAAAVFFGFLAALVCSPKDKS